MSRPIERPHKFDKLTYMKKLRATQLTQEQSEAIADGTGELGDAVVEQIMHAIDQRDFATKGDLALLSTELKGEFSQVRSEFKAEIAVFRADTSSEFSSVKAEIAALRADTISTFNALKADTNNAFNALRSDTTNAFNAFRVDTNNAFNAFRIDTNNEFNAFRVDTNNEFASVKANTNYGFENVKAEFALVRAEAKNTEERLNAKISDLRYDTLKFIVWTCAFLGFTTIGSLGGLMIYLFKTLH